MVRPSNTVSTLFNDIKNQMQVDNFDISLKTSEDEEEEVKIPLKIPFHPSQLINISFYQHSNE